MGNRLKKRRHTAFIAVGSNMGDSLVNCRKGIASLENSCNSAITGCSRFYRTEPIDYTEQDWFVNAVVRIETSLEPEALLAELNAVEAEFGRDRSGVRFGPRTLDLDIIFYEDLIIKSERLILPHPRMHKRRFVIEPLCDIAPNKMHPVLNKTVLTLLEQLDVDGQDMKPIPAENRADSGG